MPHSGSRVIGCVQPAIDMPDRDPRNVFPATDAIMQVDMPVGLLAEWGRSDMRGAH